MGKIIIFIVGLVIAVGLAFIEAWCLKVVYNFVVPFFFSNAPKMDIWIAFGVLVLINIIAQPFKSKSK